MLRWFRESYRPRLPAGERVYAVGDVHGCLDLLEDLLRRLEEDNAKRPGANVTLIMLGDLIDRGPNSRGVLTRVKAGVGWARTVALMGNHEAAMLDALDDKKDALSRWLQFGGLETLISWGIAPKLLKHGSRDDILHAARNAVTAEERAWLGRLRTSLRIGDYYFVHAGIRPGTPLEKQNDQDRLWIRRDFLESRKQHEAMIVHGHSISEEIEVRSNRIGIDTGAYMTGRLTAVALEGEQRWFLTTDAEQTS